VQNRLGHRVLRPYDSLSFRDFSKRLDVARAVSSVLALPEEVRRRCPALLHGVAGLEAATGEFASAQQHFRQVADLVTDKAAAAEASFNASQMALEQWPGAAWTRFAGQ
jgi:hypothetical protein